MVFSAGYGGLPEQAFRSEANLIVRLKGKPLQNFMDPPWENPTKTSSKQWNAMGKDLLSGQIVIKDLPAKAIKHPERADWARILGRKLATFGITLPDWKQCGPRPSSKRISLSQPLTRLATRHEDLQA